MASLPLRSDSPAAPAHMPDPDNDNRSAFAESAPALLASGFSPVPIVPGDKIPGIITDGQWRFHKGWNQYCAKQPGSFQVGLWSKWERAGVGAALGRSLLAVDIDRDDLVDPVLAVLPPVVVAKRGRKGLTVFYRGNTDALRSRGFKVDGHGVLDFLSHGKQTVLPPSLHPSGIHYEWTTDRTLLDTRIADLPEFTVAHFEAMLAVLVEFGWQQESHSEAASAGLIESNTNVTDFFRRLNEDALANLDAWVPALGLAQRPLRAPDGTYRAVAEWRPSSSGKPLRSRSRNLSFDRRGIKDFGDGDKGYTALDVVLAAHDLPQDQFDQAAVWLGERLGYDFLPKIVLTSKPKPAPEPVASAFANTDDRVVLNAPDRRFQKSDGPTPFEWIDPDALPRREWLYSTLFIRKEISATLAPGGVGKTSLNLAEALAMVSGKPLLGVGPAKRLRVWIWNGEEPYEEMQRRIMAACRHFRLQPSDIDGLFVDTAETMPLVVAEDSRNGTTINRPVVDQLTRWLQERRIDILFIDPFISTHNVNENDNNAIQKAATGWKEVAQGANVAISAAHHTRKTQGRDATAEDSRGAKSFTDKCRVARSLNHMSKEEAERYGVDPANRRTYFSFDRTETKANMSPAVGDKAWFRTVGVVIGRGRKGNLDPGDSIGVVEAWSPPSMKALAGLSAEEIKQVKEEVAVGNHRADERSPLWVGNAITAALGLDPAPGVRKRVKAIVARLIEDGHLRVVDRLDGSRRLKQFVEVGADTPACSSAPV